MDTRIVYIIILFVTFSNAASNDSATFKYKKLPDKIKFWEMDNIPKYEKDNVKKLVTEIRQKGYISVPEIIFKDFEISIIKNNIALTKDKLVESEIKWVIAIENTEDLDMEFLGFIYGGIKHAGRVFRDKDNNLIQLSEINYHEYDSFNLPLPMINTSINGYPASITVSKSKDGKTKTSLSWVDEYRLCVLEINKNTMNNGTENSLTRFAVSLYK